MSHTPGPWTVKLGGIEPCLPTDPRWVEEIIAADGTHVVCFGHDYDEYGSISLEDAQLIAAAPDLLDALKRRLHNYPDLDCACAACMPMMAAINKAEGR